MTTDRRFLVLFRPVRDGFWTSLTPEEFSVIEAHYEALVAMHDSGTLEFAGRDADASYGMAICKLSTKEEVEGVFAENPAVAGGLLTIEVRPYNLALDEQPQ